jgi:hypothetical protein
MAATAQAPAGRPRRGVKPLLFLFLFVILVVGGFAAYVWSALHINYSEGERAGFIQKFSRKGWICKTWEGELAMMNLPGTMPELFKFSVRDPAVAARLNQTIGQRVRVHYEQHKGVPSDCFGETEYFVTQVDPVGP